MDNSQLKFVATVEDQASAAIEKIQAQYETLAQYEARQVAQAEAHAAATTKATQATDELAGANDKATGSFGSLFTSFTAATLAADAIVGTYHTVVNVFEDSIKAANGSQLALNGLASTAAAFGGSADKATAAAKTLTADGLLTITDSATALRNLLSSGLNLDQATRLMDIYKDRAAFGRQNTIEYGQAVQNLAESFKTQSSQIGNLSGMTENYNQIIATGAAQMGKSVSSLSEAETAQAKYLGTVALSNGSVGDAARYAETYAGEQTRLANATQNAEIALGEGLQPAVENLQKGFVALMTGGMADANKNLPVLQGNFLALSTGVRFAMDAVAGFGTVTVAAFAAIRDHSTQPLDDAIMSVGNHFKSTVDDMDSGFAKIASGASTAAGAVSGSATQQAESMSRAARSIQNAIADENRSFAEANADRKQSFNDSLTAMVAAHQEKVRSITEQIDAETKSYTDAMLRRQEAYNDQVASLEDNHKDKVTDINKQIADEQQRVTVVNGIQQTAANQKRLTELQDNLDKENDKYNDAFAKLKSRYDREVAAAKEAEDSKIGKLQTSLAQQQAILQAHAADVARVGQQQVQDDISTLERKFSQEDAKAAQHHADALANIRQRSDLEGTTQGSGMVQGIAKGAAAALPGLTSQMDKVGQDAGKALGDGLTKGVMSGNLQVAGQKKMDSGIGGFLQSLASGIDHATGAITGGKAILSALGHILAYDAGTDFHPGGMALVGESGPELVNLPRGSSVMTANDTRQMLDRGNNRNVTVQQTNHIYQPTDVPMVLEKLSFDLARRI